MARDDSDFPRDPERKRGGRNGAGSGERRQSGRAVAGAPPRGRSGYGIESIRPLLRQQLEYQKLMQPSFPPPDEEDRDDRS